MKEFKSKMILNTHDGSMENLKLEPRKKDTSLEFEIKYYNEEDVLAKVSLIFKGVIAIDFRVNYFDNGMASELGGFYEVFEKDYKIKIIEDLFENRRHGNLIHGDYKYDSTDENDSLNWRKPIDDIRGEMDDYHLYQLQTDGGIFLVLAKSFYVLERDSI